jgi:all-trans-retinol dehydrogenase (NAD+)
MRFEQRGGFRSKWFWFWFLCILYSLYAILKKTGLWYKKSVRGKHVFLTGAGSGLGRLTAIRLAKLGAKLTLVDINEQGCQQTKRMIKAQTKSDDVQVF